MHIKLDISNWNIIIILSVLLGAGNPELLILFGVFCNMFRYYVIISFFLTIKYYLILKYLINSW